MSEVATELKTYRFDQMAVQVKDKVHPNDADVDRYVGLEHIDPESLKIRRWGEPSDVESTKILFRSGDIIFGKRRAYQRKLAVADFDGICSAHAMVLRPKTDVVLKEFLPFFMQTDTFMERAVKISVGGLSPTINWRDLAKEEFVLPTIDEQRRIVEACAALEDSLAKLYDLTEAARIAWLSTVQHFEDIHARNVKPLGDLLEAIEAGRSIVGSDMSPSNSEYAVLKVSAVDPFGFQPRESKVLLDQTDFLAQHAVCAGDLLITRSNTSALVGETCIVDRDYPHLMLCDKTLRLVPKPEVSKSTLWHMLQSNRVRQQIVAVATGTGSAMKNISQPKIRALRVCMPRSSEEADLLDTRLDNCIRVFRKCQARRQACQQVKKAMLTQIMSEALR